MTFGLSALLLPLAQSGTAATAIRTGALLCGAATALLTFSLVFWTARDVAARTKSNAQRLGALALVLVFNVLGLLIYLLLRPRETIAERYERELIEDILTREVSTAALARAQAATGTGIRPVIRRDA